jgi:hypothetical protein
MPVKKSSAKKKPVKKTKQVAKKKPKLVCDVCGFALTVDNVCGCIEEHPIMCCGTQMSRK